MDLAWLFWYWFVVVEASCLEIGLGILTLIDPFLFGSEAFPIHNEDFASLYFVGLSSALTIVIGVMEFLIMHEGKKNQQIILQMCLSFSDLYILIATGHRNVWVPKTIIMVIMAGISLLVRVIYFSWLYATRPHPLLGSEARSDQPEAV